MITGTNVVASVERGHMAPLSKQTGGRRGTKHGTQLVSRTQEFISASDEWDYGDLTVRHALNVNT